MASVNFVCIYIKMQAHPQNIWSHLLFHLAVLFHTHLIFLDTSPVVAAEASFLAKVLRNKLVQNKNEVEVQRNDPSSPLHSVKSFEELPL